MSYEVLYNGEPITELTPAEAGVAWHDDLTLDQEKALVYTDLYNNL
jgi:hypothetical protein